jgi:hypothetical protein
MKTLRGFRAPLAFTALTLLAATSTQAREKRGYSAADKSNEVAASVWNLPGQGATVSMATFDQSAPVKTTLTEDTMLKGVCVHCEVDLQCRASDLAKKCPVCPCSLSNYLCLTGKASVDKNWQAMLRGLAQGTRIRLEYSVAGKPEQGIKRLTVDHRGAVLPVEGLDASTPQQLQALGKSVGAAHIERNTEGNRLQLSLNDDWTVDKEARLEKELTKIGAKVTGPQAETVVL